MVDGDGRWRQVIALALIVQLQVGAVNGQLLFGSGRDWVVIDAKGAVVRHIALSHPELPVDVRDAALSPDGTRMLVAGWSTSAGNVLLFLFDLEKQAVRTAGESRGFHAAPAFSSDGKWLLFAHHPTLGGPVGMHEARAYAQLYRQSIDGGASEPLTTSDGCHMNSSSRGADEIYFAHSNCLGGRRIEVLRAGKESALTQFSDGDGEPSLSSDARFLVMSRVKDAKLEIVELALPSGRAEVIWRGTRVEERFRPQYLGQTRDVVFQLGSTLLAVRRNENNRVEVVGRLR